MNPPKKKKDSKSCRVGLALTPGQDNKLRKFAKALNVKHTTLAALWVLERLTGEISKERNSWSEKEQEVPAQK